MWWSWSCILILHAASPQPFTILPLALSPPTRTLLAVWTHLNVKNFRSHCITGVCLKPGVPIQQSHFGLLSGSKDICILKVYLTNCFHDHLTHIFAFMSAIISLYIIYLSLSMWSVWWTTGHLLSISNWRSAETRCSLLSLLCILEFSWTWEYVQQVRIVFIHVTSFIRRCWQLFVFTSNI